MIRLRCFSRKAQSWQRDSRRWTSVSNTSRSPGKARRYAVNQVQLSCQFTFQIYSLSPYRTLYKPYVKDSFEPSPQRSRAPVTYGFGQAESITSCCCPPLQNVMAYLKPGTVVGLHRQRTIEARSSLICESMILIITVFQTIRFWILGGTRRWATSHVISKKQFNVSRLLLPPATAKAEREE